MTASEVKEVLGLEPHPREGGWYVRTWESGERLGAEAFPEGRYVGERWTGTAIYYLLEPGTFSEMHRLRSDEVFHHYLGDAVEQMQLEEGGDGRVVVLGADLRAGQRPQVVVRRGVWQGARLVEGGAWALLGVRWCRGLRLRIMRRGCGRSWWSGGRGGGSGLWGLLGGDGGGESFSSSENGVSRYQSALGGLPCTNVWILAAYAHARCCEPHVAVPGTATDFAVPSGLSTCRVSPFRIIRDSSRGQALV